MGEDVALEGHRLVEGTTAGVLGQEGGTPAATSGHSRRDGGDFMTSSPSSGLCPPVAQAGQGDVRPLTERHREELWRGDTRLVRSAGSAVGSLKW